MSKKMTLSQALAEVTLLDKRIPKSIGLLQPLVPLKANEIPQGYESQQAFITASTSKMQSVKDLIGYRFLLKSAILKANQETVVSVDLTGSIKDYTIAELVVFRETEMAFYATLEKHCSVGTAKVLSICESTERDAVAKADKAIETMLSGSEPSKEASETMQQIQEQYNASTIKRPVGIPDFIEFTNNMPQAHDELLKTIDHTLSVSNATTYITI